MARTPSREEWIRFIKHSFVSQAGVVYAYNECPSWDERVTPEHSTVIEFIREHVE